MASQHFVGRQDSVTRLRSVLTGETRCEGNLTIQSVEGPGGIGKTCLFDHVYDSLNLADRHYLRLRIDGNAQEQKSLMHATRRMVDSAQSEMIRGRTPGSLFPSVGLVMKAADDIKSQAAAEYLKMHPGDEAGGMELSERLDLAFLAGHAINVVFPFITKRVVGVPLLLPVTQAEKHRQKIENAIVKMQSLANESPRFFERLGLGRSKALRNSIRENACLPLADAIVADLSAILAGYRARDRFKPTLSRLKGVDRLLLIVDDYENLQESLGEFLVGHLFPALRSNAKFESVVVILGRDQLEATHTAWDQHLRSSLLERIALEPLSRQEMDELVESYGIQDREKKDRAWSDTQGYPFLVQRWIEETQAGGASALMRLKFFDRTTRWLNDQQKRWLDNALFLKDVDVRSFTGMLGDAAEAEQAFRWFERDGSVRDTTSDTFRVREFVRSRLADYLRISNPDRYDELLKKAKACSNGHA